MRFYSDLYEEYSGKVSDRLGRFKRFVSVALTVVVLGGYFFALPFGCLPFTCGLAFMEGWWLLVPLVGAEALFGLILYWSVRGLVQTWRTLRVVWIERAWLSIITPFWMLAYAFLVIGLAQGWGTA